MNVAILGYGTVGSGVYDVLTKNAALISKRVGFDLDVKYVLDLREFPGDPVEKILVHDFEAVIDDPDVDVVVEVMGGIHPAYEFSKEALLRGKSVCTSNKELVAKHGAELLEIARENNCNYLFEASVGGGIPIIRQLIRSITADDIERIDGILNGTTNYMMTKMKLDGLQFDEVLKRAQDKGYAERNPAADIEGHDACRKIAILTSLAYGQQVDYEDIHTEGITKISDIDVEYANRLGRAIKLLGSSEKTAEGKVFAIVAPKMIKESNPLFMVSGVFNAILIEGNMLGEVMCYGKGAGKLPTASAVVSDVIDAAKHAGKNIPIIWTREKLELGSFSDMKHAFFLRIPAYKKAEALDRLPVNTVLEDVKAGEIGIVTELMTEGEFEKASAELGVISMIRYEL
ncbi:MAG: homoserine dehydrogenase [Lachnospiraceae bacterium]|nr:homoserine dehydrogenase [Lachnospiraceae bacterium]